MLQKTENLARSWQIVVIRQIHQITQVFPLQSFLLYGNLGFDTFQCYCSKYTIIALLGDEQAGWEVYTMVWYSLPSLFIS